MYQFRLIEEEKSAYAKPMLYVGVIYTGLGISWRDPWFRWCYLNINLELTRNKVYIKVKHVLKIYFKLSNSLVILINSAELFDYYSTTT